VSKQAYTFDFRSNVLVLGRDSGGTGFRFHAIVSTTGQSWVPAFDIIDRGDIEI